MRCRDVEALWDELRDGPESGNDRALAHLRHCTDCRHSFAEYEGVAYCLHCLPAVDPPQSLLPRILGQLRALRIGLRSQQADAFGRLSSPLGTLAIAWRDAGITFIGIERGESDEAARDFVERRLRRPVRGAEPPEWVVEAVAGFFRTWHADPDRIDMSGLTAFERLALTKAAQIPPGQVRSYGWVAREIGKPQAARAVGQVMARNPVALFFPCHRVVDAAGELHNYGYGLELKARLLHMEGYRPARAGRRRVEKSS